MNIRPFRASHLVQWNVRQSKDNPTELVDRVVEAVMHQQCIPFEHTSEYRSVYSYDKLWMSLEHYDHGTGLDVADAHLRHGLKRASMLFAPPDANFKLKPVSLMSASANLFAELSIRGDRSAGLTSYGENKYEAFATGLDKAISILVNDKAPAPCLAGVRTQRKGKTRLVWQYPLEMTIIEAIIARPLIDYFKRNASVMTFGDYSHEVGTRMRRAVSNNRAFYSTDLSQFDSCVNEVQIHRFFETMRQWFDLTEEVYPGVTVARVFERVESYLRTSPIVMPKRESKYPVMVTGIRGGVRSGSYFTQMCDSFANASLILAASHRFNLGVADNDIFVLGDDCLFFCNNTDGVKLLQRLSSFYAQYGFKLSATKSTSGLVCEPIEYLGRVWRNGFPVRQMSKIIRGALYPENYRRYSRNRAERQKQALNTIGSYLLTSYVEDPVSDLNSFNHLYFLTDGMSSGYTQFLLREGLIPGDVLRRAVY